MKSNLSFLLLMIVFSHNINGQIIIDSTEVSAGWNLIGSLSNGVTIDIITTEPPGIIEGSIYGYNTGGGYYGADTLNRGQGYWVKVNQDGKIIYISYTDCGTVNYAGKTYNTIIIDDQCWLKENLDVGTMIPVTQEQTDNGTIEKYCYDDDPNNCNIYGGLYQWDELMQYITTAGSQGICPPGWHIPTLTELQILSTAVGGDGHALKSVGQGAGTNTSGFSALLAGFRNPSSFYSGLGTFGYFWSSTENDITYANYLVLYDNAGTINLDYLEKTFGFCIRCLKD